MKMVVPIILGKLSIQKIGLKIAKHIQVNIKSKLMVRANGKVILNSFPTLRIRDLALPVIIILKLPVIPQPDLGQPGVIPRQSISMKLSHRPHLRHPPHQSQHHRYLTYNLHHRL